MKQFFLLLCACFFVSQIALAQDHYQGSGGGYSTDGYQASGYQHGGYMAEGYQPGGYQTGYQPEGYSMEGYQQEHQFGGYPQEGYQASGYQQEQHGYSEGFAGGYNYQENQMMGSEGYPDQMPTEPSYDNAYPSMFQNGYASFQNHDAYEGRYETGINFGHDANSEGGYPSRFEGSSDFVDGDIQGGYLDTLGQAPHPTSYYDPDRCCYVNCCYRPCYYYTCSCDYVPQYRYVRNCRTIPKYYKQYYCRWVPQYYAKTLCRYVPDYYYSCYCSYLPRYKYKLNCYYKQEISEMPCCDPCDTCCDSSCDNNCNY